MRRQLNDSWAQISPLMGHLAGAAKTSNVKLDFISGAVKVKNSFVGVVTEVREKVFDVKDYIRCILIGIKVNLYNYDLVLMAYRENDYHVRDIGVIVLYSPSIVWNLFGRVRSYYREVNFFCNTIVLYRNLEYTMNLLHSYLLRGDRFRTFTSLYMMEEDYNEWYRNGGVADYFDGYLTTVSLIGGFITGLTTPYQCFHYVRMVIIGNPFIGGRMSNHYALYISYCVTLFKMLWLSIRLSFGGPTVAFTEIMLMSWLGWYAMLLITGVSVWCRIIFLIGKLIYGEVKLLIENVYYKLLRVKQWLLDEIEFLYITGVMKEEFDLIQENSIVRLSPTMEEYYRSIGGFTPTMKVTKQLSVVKSKVIDHYSKFSKMVSLLNYNGEEIVLDMAKFGVLLYRFFEISGVTSAIAFVTEFMLLLFPRMDASIYLECVLNEIKDLFKGGFVPTALTVPWMINVFASKVVRLIGYVLIGPITYVLIGKYLPRNELTEFVFASVTSFDGAVEALSELLRAIIANPRFLVTGNLRDVKVLMSPAYSLYCDCLEVEAANEALRIDATYSELDAVKSKAIEVIQLSQNCLLGSKASVGDVNHVNSVKKRLKDLIKTIDGKLANRVASFHPVVIEIISERTNIGKSHFISALATSALDAMGYRELNGLIYYMTDEKFDEAASSRVKVCMFNDPNKLNTKEFTGTQLDKLAKLAGGEPLYIEKANADEKQKDKWDPRLLLVSANIPCYKIAADGFRKPAMLARRIPYSFDIILDPRYTNVDQIKGVPYDDAWILTMYKWNDNTNKQCYEVQPGVYRFTDVLNLVMYEYKKKVRELDVRLNLPRIKPCSECMADFKGTCTHVKRLVEPIVNGRKLRSTVEEKNLARTTNVVTRQLFKELIIKNENPYFVINYHFRLLGDCLEEMKANMERARGDPNYHYGYVWTHLQENRSRRASQFVLLLSLLFAIVCYFYPIIILIIFTIYCIDVYMGYTEKFFIKMGVKMLDVKETIESLDEMMVWFLYYKNKVPYIIGFVLIGIGYCTIKKSKTKEDGFVPTMHTEFSNKEVNAQKVVRAPLPIKYPPSSNGVQDLHKWERDYIRARMVFLNLEREISEDLPVQVNRANGFMLKGNRCLIPRHSLQKGMSYKFEIVGSKYVSTSFKPLHPDDTIVVSADTVLIYQWDVPICTDASKFVMEQAPVEGQEFKGFLCFIHPESKVFTSIPVMVTKKNVAINWCQEFDMRDHYIANSSVPIGASGGVCYIVVEGRPIIIGGISSTDAFRKLTAITPWYKTKVDIDDRLSPFSTPPLDERYDENVKFIQDLELSDEEVEYANEWGLKASFVRPAMVKAQVTHGELINYDFTCQWRSKLSEATKVAIPEFVKPPHKIDGVSAVDAHIMNSTTENLLTDTARLDIGKLFYEINRDRLKRNSQSKPFASNYEALRGYDTVDGLPLSSLNLSTSSGVPCHGIKRDHVVSAPILGDVHNFVLTDDAAMRVGKLEALLEKDVLNPVIFNIGYKTSEPRKVNKAMRIFFFMSMYATIVMRKYLLPTFSALIGGFMETGVAIGGVTFNEDVVKMFNALRKTGKRKFYALDGKHFDISHLRQTICIFLEVVRLYFEDKGWSEEDFLKFKRALLMIVMVYIHYKKIIIMLPSGMASGIPVTTILNCLINMLCVLVWSMMISKRNSLDVKLIYDDIGKLFYGDDECVSHPDDDIYRIEDYVEASRMLGYEKTAAATKDGQIMDEPLLNGVEFLKRNFSTFVYQGKTYLVLKLNFVSVYKMLFFREPKKTITEGDWFIQVFRNAQYEIAFHGKDKYQELRPFLEEYKKEFSVDTQVEEWDFWMEKFLSGVPPYNYS